MKRNVEETWDGGDPMTRDMLLQSQSALQEFTPISMYILQYKKGELTDFQQIHPRFTRRIKFNELPIKFNLAG